MLEALAQKRGWLAYDRTWLRAVRTAQTRGGVKATGGPRFLVRVDEFPIYSGLDDDRYGYDASQEFHGVMAAARLPYLMAVVPQWTHAPLDPEGEGGRDLDARDRELIVRMQADGVVLAQHGDTHRSRFRDPRRRSELSGLTEGELAGLLDRGRRRLADAGCETRVFVAPFNRFDASQWPVLAERYDVITGGPESVLKLGFAGGPAWRGDAVYLPCYAPLYGRAATVLPAAERVIAAGVSTWVPIVLHAGWEAEDEFAALRRLAQTLAGHAVSWEDLLAAVDASRHDAGLSR